MKKIKDEIKFIYVELKKTFSDEPSFFSSKRIERMILFVTALIASNFWFWTHYPNLTVSEVVLYISTHLGFAGYTMAQTQKEKLKKKEDENKH